MPRNVRVPLIQGRYNFTAHGLTRAIERNQNASRLIQLVQTVAQSGGAWVPYINMPGIFKALFEAYHLPNPEELLNPNAADNLQQHAQAVINSQDPVVQQQAVAAGKAHVEAAKGDQASQQQLLAHVFSQHPNPNQ